MVIPSTVFLKEKYLASLIGSALGLFSSAIPKAMDMWQDKNDKAQAEITLDQTAIDASIREVESIHTHDSKIKGSIWVENSRALVRQIMAYSFMDLFFAVEVTAFITLVDAGLWAGEALQNILDDRVMALWANILAFYFGGRQFNKKGSKARPTEGIRVVRRYQALISRLPTFSPYPKQVPKRDTLQPPLCHRLRPLRLRLVAVKCQPPDILAR